MKVAVKDITNTISADELDAGRLQDTFDISVSDGSKIALPDSFATPLREDLVKLAVASSRANRRQPYGSRPHVGKRKPMSGMKHSVEWWGKGRGVSRIMRRTGQKRAAQNPHTLGGRRAHGPKVEKIWARKLNQKERRLARDTALSATTDMEMVSSRGHQISEEVSALPIILGNYVEVRDGKKEEFDFESFNHGSATRKTPKSILLVVKEKSGLAQAARNLPGVDVVAAKDLNAEDLAPGGALGRLTVFTKSAVEELN